MQKRILCLTVSLCMILTLIMGMPISANAATSGIYVYSVSNGTATITDVIDSTISGEVDIPANIGGYTVAAIGGYAFSDCKNLTGVTIPETVKSIGDYAFQRCDTMTSVRIPDSVTSIGKYAFGFCYKLTDVELPNKLTKLDWNAFCDCRSLKSIVIPESMTSIGYNVFLNCYALESVTIPKTVTAIGSGAFGRCKSLTDIVIPDSVTTIRYDAFFNCSALKTVTLGKGVNYVGQRAFYSCDALTEVNIKDISAWLNIEFADNTSNPLLYAKNLYINSEPVTDFAIPQEVTEIKKFSFINCATLTNLTIPNWVKKIGSYAFSGCTGLKNVSIPDSITTIEAYTFDGCTSLENAMIAEGVTSIGDNAFSNCCNLTSLTIPSTVTDMGNWAFASCGSLTDIIIPDGVSSIKDNTFYSCYRLKSAVIPGTVTNIGTRAFEYCSFLTDVYYCGTREDWSSITIGNYNKHLTNANIHYNHKMPGSEDTKPVLDNTNIKINKRGTATARFIIKDKNGNVMKNRGLTYRFSGYDTTYYNKTDENGMITVTTPVISGINEIRTMTVVFSGYELEQAEYTFDVEITDLNFSQSWEGKVSKSAGVEASLGVKGGIGVLDGEATLGAVGAGLKHTRIFGVEDSYKDGMRNLRLSSAIDSEIAMKSKAGLFADVNVAGLGAETSVIDVYGKASTGATTEVAINLVDYDPYNTAHTDKIGYFLLDTAVGVHGSNVVLRKILEQFDIQTHNETKTSRSALLGAGANIATLETDNGNFDSGLFSIGTDTSFGYSALKNSDNKILYTAKMATDAGYDIGNIGVKSGEKNKSGSEVTVYSHDFINNELEFSALTDGLPELFEMKMIEENRNHSILWNKNITNYYSKFSFSDENAEIAIDSNTKVKNFAEGKKGWLNSVEFVKATDDILSSDAEYTYSREKETVKGIDIPLNFGITAGLGVDIGLGFSGMEKVNYEIESGKKYGDAIYMNSNSYADDEVENSKKTLSEILTEPLKALADKIGECMQYVSGEPDEKVKCINAEVEGTSGLAIDIFTVNSPRSTSYAILGIGNEMELFSASSVANTVGEPYIIRARDEAGNVTGSFESVTLTLFFDDEMLNLAGITNQDDLENLKIYRWDDEKCVYVCLGGTLDIENMSVSLDITENGQYILAVDNCGPAITEFNVSDCSSTPTITAVVADMSGIEDFEFKLDGQVVVDNENLSKYYNCETALFSYKVEEELSRGRHRVEFFASDSAGNMLSSAGMYSFRVDTYDHEIIEVKIPELVMSDKMTISAKVSEPEYMDMFAYVEYEGKTYSYQMEADENGVFNADISPIPACSKLNAYVGVYDEYGNFTHSDKTCVFAVYEEDGKIASRICNINEDGADVVISNFTDGTLSGYMTLVGYDKDGVLAEINSFPYETGEMYAEMQIKISASHDSYKLFWWNDKMSPYCGAYFYKNKFLPE